MRKLIIFKAFKDYKMFKGFGNNCFTITFQNDKLIVRGQGDVLKNKNIRIESSGGLEIRDTLGTDYTRIFIRGCARSSDDKTTLIYNLSDLLLKLDSITGIPVKIQL